jgi:hypothetical protein
MAGKAIGFVNPQGRYEVSYFFTEIDNEERAILQTGLNERAQEHFKAMEAA